MCLLLFVHQQLTFRLDPVNYFSPGLVWKQPTECQIGVSTLNISGSILFATKAEFGP